MATGSKLLLADDSITIQKVINLTFADEGMMVTTVGNGDLALTKIEEIKPDIVMLDVHMPGLNGYEICERLKQDDNYKHIPVILLVGSFEPFDEEEARRVGADDFLTKPFQSIRQLISKVGSLLHERPKPAADETPVFAGDRTLEYEVSPGQEFAGISNVVGHGAPASVPAEPQVEDRSTWAGRAGAMNDTATLDDESIEARPFTGEVHQHDTYTGAARPTRPLSAMEVDDFVYGGAPASVVSAAAENMANMKTANHGNDPVVDLGDIDSLRGSLASEDAILDLDDSQPGAMPALGYAAVSTPPAPPLAVGSSVSLSPADLTPEMIDAIARRVVERMSDQAVREIAWEVVPQLADLHIKRQLEEK